MAKATKKEVLGRGLSALLNNVSDNDTPVSGNAVSRSGIVEVPIDKIVPNPFQPRTSFDEQSIVELGQSISELGLIQPITVRKNGVDTYELVLGERRFRASKLIGKDTIAAYVRVANDQEMLEMALVENIQRRDLDPIEVALSYQRLIDEMNFTQDVLSKRVGKKRSTVANYLRLLKLDPIIQMGIRDDFLSMGHGRCLVNITDEKLQVKIYEEVIAKQLSVRATEQLVARLKEQSGTLLPKSPKQDAYITKLVLSQMGHFLKAPVSASVDDKGHGKITITFKGEKDFERIHKILT